MDPVRAVGVHLVLSLDCWCFKDPINGGSQWGIVKIGRDGPSERCYRMGSQYG